MSTFAADLATLLQPKFPRYPVAVSLLSDTDVERITGRPPGIAKIEMTDTGVRVHSAPVVPVYLVSIDIGTDKLATLQGEDTGQLPDIVLRLEKHFNEMLRDVN